MAEPSRFEKFNLFIDRGQARLRASGCAAAASLWLTLWRFERAETNVAEVSVDTLARCYGTHRRNVQRMLAQLERYGYLITLTPGSRGRGSCATYRLALPEIHASPASPKRVTETHITDAVDVNENASPERVIETEKCVTMTHIPQGPVGTKNASPVVEKRVTMTHEQKQKKKKDISANAGEGIEKTAAEEKKLRPRDALFDAIAEVTGAAPKAAGSHIGAVRKALVSEEPPFSPEEVREFGRRFWELCPWAKQDNRQRPELGELQKHIGKVRTVQKSPTAEAKGFIDFGTQPSARKESVA